MSSLGNVIYNPPLEEAKINLEQIKDLKQLCVMIKFSYIFFVKINLINKSI